MNRSTSLRRGQLLGLALFRACCRSTQMDHISDITSLLSVHSAEPCTRQTSSTVGSLRWTTYQTDLAFSHHTPKRPSLTSVVDGYGLSELTHICRLLAGCLSWGERPQQAGKLQLSLSLGAVSARRARHVLPLVYREGIVERWI